jgi:hypothetical protein
MSNEFLSETQTSFLAVVCPSSDSLLCIIALEGHFAIKTSLIMHSIKLSSAKTEVLLSTEM